MANGKKFLTECPADQGLVYAVAVRIPLTLPNPKFTKVFAQ
ncbi:MAG: hypothetical protein V7K27_09805 [Nostoc sp.]